MSARSSIALDLSGVGVVIRGLDRVVARRLEARYGPFLAGEAAEPMLRIRVSRGGEAPVTEAFGAKRMRGRFAGERAVFTMPEGRIEVRRDGSADALLAPLDAETCLFTVVNLLLAGLAFVGPARGIVALHAAGVILDGRAFLLVGAAGAGKSTFASVCAGQGATVLSDDVVLLDASTDRFDALATPFRQDPARPAPPGRAPVAAILLPQHAPEPSLHAVSRIVARARLVANLPFVNERYGRDAALDRVVERLATRGCIRELRFGPDAGFVPLLRSLPGD